MLISQVEGKFAKNLLIFNWVDLTTAHEVTGPDTTGLLSMEIHKRPSV